MSDRLTAFHSCTFASLQLFPISSSNCCRMTLFPFDFRCFQKLNEVTGIAQEERFATSFMSDNCTNFNFFITVILSTSAVNNALHLSLGSCWNAAPFDTIFDQKYRILTEQDEFQHRTNKHGTPFCITPAQLQVEPINWILPTCFYNFQSIQAWKQNVG